MSYAHAVKRIKINAVENRIKVIRSQAETELGRKLEDSEEYSLLSRFSSNMLCEQIQKVSQVAKMEVYMHISVWIRGPKICIIALQEA